MFFLIVFLALQEEDYPARLATLHETLIPERRKAAEGFEQMKAWAYARGEYQKILRLDPKDDFARGRLEGGGALPIANERLSSENQAKAADLVWAVGRVAAPGHAALARWCASKGMSAEATLHWRFALLYSPVHGEALKALDFQGDGAAAVDPLWKDVRWKELISKADGGKVTTEESDLEKKWSVKNLQRSTPSLRWEGVNVSQAHLTTLARLAEADLVFMRRLLGDEKAGLCVDRIIVMTGHENYFKYIEDFWDAPKSTKDMLKMTGGSQNVARREFAMFAQERGSLQHDSYISHAVAEFVLAAALGIDDYDKPPAWLKEGIGCASELLFRGTAQGSCVAMPDGTTTGDVPWKRSDRWRDNLNTLVSQGRDSPMGELAFVELNSMKGDQRAKSASVVTFLALRWPAGFRGIIAEARKNPKDVASQFGKGLGITVEEFDEFWRRWIRAR